MKRAVRLALSAMLAVARTTIALVVVLSLVVMLAAADIGGSRAGGSMSAASILTALLTVDGAASTLDADLLDGISSAAFALLAGNTFTGGNVYSAVTTDITAASAEDVRIVGGAVSGSVQLQSIDDKIDLLDSAGNTDGQLTSASASTNLMLAQGTASTTGAVRFTSASSVIGSQADVAANAVTTTFGDSMNVAGGTSLAAMYGGGAFGVIRQLAVTIADDGAGTSPTDTTSPNSSQVEVTCNDANGCVYSPGETSVVDGWQIAICNVSAANVVTVTESAGTIRVTGADTTTVLNTMECTRCVYSGTEWGCA